MTGYSDRLPTSALIRRLLRDHDRDEEIAELARRAEDAERREKVLLAAVEALDGKSLAAQRRLRTADPVYAAGYEQGMVDAREDLLAASRLSNRNRVVAQVRTALSEVGLDPGTAR